MLVRNPSGVAVTDRLRVTVPVSVPVSVVDITDRIRDVITRHAGIRVRGRLG
jgi:hypothetical protein